MVTENGLHGRVVQDVVTNPTIKYARAQCSSGKIEWNCGYPTGADSVQSQNESGHLCEHVFKKTRPDDFKQELSHLHACLVESHIDSPIALEKGLETMLVIAAAYKSHFEKREVCINYSKGYSLQALPNTIGKLTALKTLILPDCMDLRQLPEEIRDLTKLKIISTSERS